ncbi:MAG: adenylate/guanylate cyclase domain-containing protein [Pseudomonadota bacterium]
MALRLWIAMVMALALAALSASPAGQRWEQSYGLGLLYTLRGAVEPPDGALIIALDSDTIGWLQRNARDLDRVAEGFEGCLTPHALEVMERSRNVNLVPRALYTCLLARLGPHRPKAVAIDVKFNAERPDDAAFARAIAEAGNVVLLEGISRTGLITRARPTEAIAWAGRSTAHFQTNGVDGRTVTAYATRIGPFPEVANMPLAVWQMVEDASDPPDLAPLQPVWFYGPPGVVPTVSMRQVFERGATAKLPLDLSSHAVFIGVSDRIRPNAEDHFRMPMPITAPDRIAGVEVAASAFLNLKAGHVLWRPDPLTGLGLTTLVLAVMFGAGLLLGGWRGLLAVPVLGGLYLGGALAAFTALPAWLPVFTPVFLGLPIGIAAVQLRRYANARAIVRRLVPHQIADRWLSDLHVDRGTGALENATIMFIDLVGSTAIAEQTDPHSLEQILNIYYDAAAAEIETRDGMITEFKGDGILALFSDRIAGPEHAAKACDAAWAASSAVHDRGRAELPDAFSSIRLRIGLHTGEVTTGVIGSRARFNFNALGDSVIVAARIEQYGKEIADQREDIILLSGATRQAARLDAAGLSDEGVIRLRGRRAPVQVSRMIAAPRTNVVGAEV